MNRLHLQIFVALVDNDLSPHATASSTNKALVTVYNAIRTLEQYFGVKLLTREAHRYIDLTKTGIAVYEWGKIITKAHSKLEDIRREGILNV